MEFTPCKGRKLQEKENDKMKKKDKDDANDVALVLLWLVNF